MGRHALADDGPELVNLYDSPDEFSAVMQAVNGNRFLYGVADVNGVQFVVLTDMGVYRAVWPSDDGPMPFIEQFAPEDLDETRRKFNWVFSRLQILKRQFGVDPIVFAGDQFNEEWA